MHDDRYTNRSDLPDPLADPALDRTLRTLARFAPAPGFVDRILARVRVPLPPWARAARNWFRTLVTGPRGWVILGTVSAATAAVWTLAAVAAVQSWDAVTRGAQLFAREIAVPAWQDLAGRGTAALATARENALGPLAELGIPLELVAGGYAILTLVSLVALRRLIAEPAGRRMHHAAR